MLRVDFPALKFSSREPQMFIPAAAGVRNNLQAGKGSLAEGR